MSKRNSGRRGRPRKRKSGAGRSAEGGPAAAVASPADAAPTPAAPTRAAADRGHERDGGRSTQTGAGRSRGARRPPEVRPDRRDPGGVGERPEAPWHPWPFSELLILVGAIGSLVGFAAKAQALLFASLGSVLLGTLEFTIREHRAGYRSHTSLLAAVPTALLHGLIALGLFAAGVRGELLVVLPLLIDVPLFWVLFRTLRARFEDARRERVFALKQR